ncbi:MAG: glycosyl hydrolase [Novosphingobium sp.]
MTETSNPVGGFKARILGAILVTSMFVPAALQAQEQAPAPRDLLAEAFRDPPNSARPRVWWHWMNGNVTKDGIRKDMEWMKRVGIGGLQNFDANFNTPQIVDKRLVYMSPEWKDAFRFAAQTADRLDLELGIASSPGFSETGGPWVQPQDGIKKLVWSETELVGGKRFRGILTPPPRTTGPFQNIQRSAGVADLSSGGKPVPSPTYYADVAVLAVPAALAGAGAAPKVSVADKPVDGGALFDADPGTTLAVTGAVTLDYGKARTVASATAFFPGSKPLFGEANVVPQLESSDDGVVWRPIAAFAVANVPTTISFDPVAARWFRVALRGTGSNAAASKSAKITDLQLTAEPRVHAFEAKAGFTVSQDYYAMGDTARGAVQPPPPERVIDLTKQLGADGSLDWTPPTGTWRVIRFGYSLVGTKNHPAPAEATGLEVDKFDGLAVRNYLETYLGMYRDAVGADLVGKRGVRVLLNDSIEVGATNWTPKLVDQFKRLRGYDPTPWLPVLAGTLIGSREASDGFLFDFRRTLADLMASEHYGIIAEVAHANGLLVYGEALEDHRPSLGDDMAMRSYADVPMAAMWTYDRKVGPKLSYIADIKGAASVAHLAGKTVVAAESLTAFGTPWAFGPADLRRVIDLEFALGVTRPVIHTSVHQPVDDKVPGLSLYSIGQHFNRHESWAELAKPWVDYMARSSLLLQQGRNVADVAYFYGEEGPLTGLFGDKAITGAPIRHAYDFVNYDTLVELGVDYGEVVSKGGARYRALYLGGSSQRMSLAALRRVAALAEAGASIVGTAPVGSPGLGDGTPEYTALVGKLWSGQGVTKVGKGQVFAATDVEQALGAMGVKPDFAYAKPAADSEVLFAHRRMDDGDLYFVTNRANRAEQVEARFRVTGKTPELWRADTGTSEPVSYRSEGGETVVPLAFGPEESFFVVFRKPATAPSAVVRPAAFSPIAALDGPWDVAFQPGRGAPATLKLGTLASLSEQADAGVKYFSGVSTYTKTFTLPRGARRGVPLMLDLGQVGDLAEVRVNGQAVGTVWHAPYRLDIGTAVKRGRNTLEIRIANLWVNRLIGDAQPGAAKVTFTTFSTYPAKTPLRPSGLIGPVTLQAVK